MKVLQKLLFTFAMIAGLSLAVSAQKDKPPPKPPPPVVTPGDKKPPKGDDKPKKPNSGVVAIWVRTEGDFE